MSYRAAIIGMQAKAGDMLGFWRMNETSGTSVADSSPYGRTGSLVGTGNFVAGRGSTNALELAGAGYVRCGNADDIKIGDGTICAWIKTGNAGSGYRGIIVKQDAWGMMMNSNQFLFYDWNSGAKWSGQSPNDNNWHHLAVSFQNNVSNGTKLYIDGNLVYTATYTVKTQNYMVFLGAGGDNLAQAFTGLIEDARVYNRVLTQTEIQAIVTST